MASIWQQDYPAIEVVVVDDGSTDSTRTVAKSHPSITYIYQENQGLSAARNTGIARSTGQYLVFLDADDWLLPGALRINAGYLQQNPALAFVSGGHYKVVGTSMRTVDTPAVVGDYYMALLQGNYIGMHATVMFQRWVFAAYAYDPTLPACEDYDLYLRLARTYPVAHHTQRIAAYRMHTTNMSGNIPLMLTTVLAVLHRQKPHLRNAAEQEAYSLGQLIWKGYYSTELYNRLAAPGAARATYIELLTLSKHYPALLFRYLFGPTTSMFKKILKRYAPTVGLRFLSQKGLYQGYLPPVGQVELGDLGRTKPFSTVFGYDRGGPVDRYYIEQFLQREAAAIRGRILEIGDNEYTLRFGSDITQSDILHVDASNPRATIIGDLSNVQHVADNLFDCIVLTQTLHLIYDYKQALDTCYRLLKPGGTLLLTVPGITPIDHGEWKETWYWSFTDKALQRLFADAFPGPGTSKIQSHGNVLIAAAFLYGMGVSEVTTQQLQDHDPHFQVINTVKAVKVLPLAQ
ncbi:glycosyltransferase [Hymenobacter radiodurans]|uniref:glycosyltransferase n=1 Tax=Hymenobacter radiodurans TaxID=2496028 RepID=UPI001F111AED|nr:glycosyltransferase [Hymenobacter radiodurans]